MNPVASLSEHRARRAKKAAPGPLATVYLSTPIQWQGQEVASLDLGNADKAARHSKYCAAMKCDVLETTIHCASVMSDRPVEFFEMMTLDDLSRCMAIVGALLTDNSGAASKES